MALQGAETPREDANTSPGDILFWIYDDVIDNYILQNQQFV